MEAARCDWSASERRSWHDGRSSPGARTQATTLSKSSTPTSLSSGLGEQAAGDGDKHCFDPIDPLKLRLYVHWANGCGCGQREHFAPPNVDYRDSADMRQVNQIRSVCNPPCGQQRRGRRPPLKDHCDAGVGSRVLRLLSFVGLSSCCNPQVAAEHDARRTRERADSLRRLGFVPTVNSRCRMPRGTPAERHTISI